MRKEDFEELIGLYLSGEVPQGDKQKIREDLISEGYPEDELDELDQLNESMDSLYEGSSTPEMDTKFYNWLGSQKAEPAGRRAIIRFISGPPGRIAAGIALFIVGWLASSLLGPAGSRQNELTELSAEVVGLKQDLFLTMMQQTSSVDRIHAVNMLDEMEKVDEAIIQSLLTVLTSDQDNNVRLASLESLLPYVDSPSVREGLVRSISRQNSPLLQLRLAEVMMKLEEEGAVPEMRKVLERVNLNYSVRTKYDETVKILASL